MVLRAAILTLSPEKFFLRAPGVHYLHTFEEKVVRLIQIMLRRSRKFPAFVMPPSFLALGQYYRRFIRSFSHDASAVFAVLKTKVPLDWGQQAQGVFSKLKKAITSSPVLAHPDLTKPFVLESDQAPVGLGAVFQQKDENGQERVNAYGIKSLIPCQRKWSATELEELALNFTLEIFRPTCCGTRLQYGRTTPNYLGSRKKKDKRDKLRKWVLRVQEFHIEIEHKSGRLMSHVDALSRALIDEGPIQ